MNITDYTKDLIEGPNRKVTFLEGRLSEMQEECGTRRSALEDSIRAREVIKSQLRATGITEESALSLTAEFNSLTETIAQSQREIDDAETESSSIREMIDRARKLYQRFKKMEEEVTRACGFYSTSASESKQSSDTENVISENNVFLESEDAGSGAKDPGSVKKEDEEEKRG